MEYSHWIGSAPVQTPSCQTAHTFVCSECSFSKLEIVTSTSWWLPKSKWFGLIWNFSNSVGSVWSHELIENSAGYQSKRQLSQGIFHQSPPGSNPTIGKEEGRGVIKTINPKKHISSKIGFDQQRDISLLLYCSMWFYEVVTNILTTTFCTW